MKDIIISIAIILFWLIVAIAIILAPTHIIAVLMLLTYYKISDAYKE